MSQKSNRQMSTKTLRRAYSRPGVVQKRSRNQNHRGAESYEVERLKINLSHLVDRLSVGGKKQACEFVAKKLSALAGLEYDHCWGWKYVAAIYSGALEPGKKFIRVFELYSQHLNPRQRQWFYFSWRNRDVAAFHARSILQEMINAHMKQLGYKPVTYTRYMEVKRKQL